jgi:drug/metabolite transporter (DMT)-like permease
MGLTTETVPRAKQLKTADRPAGIDVKGFIIVIILCALWGLNQPFTKLAYVDISPILSAAVRSLLAAAGLLIYCRIYRVSLKMASGGQFHGLMIGIIFGIEFAIFYVGMDLTRASRGAILLYSQPFTTALLAHFIIPGDKLNWSRSVGLILAFIGVATVMADTTNQGGQSLTGDLLCLMAGILWAVTIIYIRIFMVSRATAAQTLFYQLLYSFPVLIAASFLFESVRFTSTWQLTGILLYQGIGVACISYLVYIILLYRYKASTVAAFTFIAPLTGVIFSGLILSEPLTVWLWLGLALVSGGLWMVNRN